LEKEKADVVKTNAIKQEKVADKEKEDKSKAKEIKKT